MAPWYHDPDTGSTLAMNCCENLKSSRKYFERKFDMGMIYELKQE
jgi:hypothetical protein